MQATGLHGPYQSEKATILWAMEEDLRASDMYPVYISMSGGDFHWRNHSNLSMRYSHFGSIPGWEGSLEPNLDDIE